MKKIKKNITKIGLSMSMLFGYVLMANSVYASNPFVKATEESAKAINETAQGALKWLIIIVCTIMGAIFLIGTDHQVQQQKEKLGQKIIGVCLILFALAIAGWVFGIFSR